MEPFQYTALQPDEFRLLYLRFDEIGVLLGDLLHVSRKDAPEYDAVSYCWNGETPSTPMACNGGSHLVTTSLFSALYVIHSSGSKRPVWADGICINQKDEAEKSFQVPLMKESYSNAKRVIVWLGHGGKSTDLAMDSIEDLDRRLDLAPASPMAHLEYFKKHNLPVEPDVWMGLRDIFGRPWFARLWVMQEVALGQEVIVMCGFKSIMWDQLSALAENLDRTGTINIVRDMRISKVDGITSMSVFNLRRNARKQGQYLGLPNLCLMSQCCNASEALDKVYALLALVNDDTRGQIHVDYSAESKRDYWKPYRTVTRLALRNDPRLFMLRIAASSSRAPNAPSWVPDLSLPESSSKFRLETYNAGGPPSPEVGSETHPSLRSMSSDESRIILRGFFVDEVSDIVPTEWPDMRHMPRYGPNGSFAMALKFLAHCQGHAQSAYGDRDVTEDLRRTLIANQLDAPQEYAPSTMDLKQTAEDAVDFLQISEEEKDFEKHFPTTKSMSSNRFLRALHTICSRRKLVCTKKGRLGLGPKDVEAGDQIYLFKGADVFFLFRRQSDGETSSLVGEAYVHGLMNGEALKDAEWSGDSPVDLTIV